MTPGERERVATVQDRMLRDADEAFYGGPICHNCGHCDIPGFRDKAGEVQVGSTVSDYGFCGARDLIVDLDGPACDEWREGGCA